LYRLAVPSKVEISVKQQLDRLQINCRDVNYIIVSHFHADHICGLRDFPNAKFICSSASFETTKNIGSRLEASRKAIFQSLLPKNIESRLWLYDLDKNIDIKKDRNMGRLHDLFCDQSILLTDLSGHAAGQTGAMINTKSDTYFLIADACWISESFKQNILPSNAARLVFENWDATSKTLKKIHQYFKANPTTHIIPSHCPQAVSHYMRKTQQERFTTSV
ncbi:MAG: MBL fold metallo-hydrolase, partial [Saprospiraceae bacterium]|nr:MBL fold metallo-hydrolase [Saprospiraceae bacterium]